MSTATELVEHRDSPYFGLDYYEEKFGAWFFGREAEGGKVITNLRASRLTLLHAESGVGKSSLLRAGVAWRMQKLAEDSLARRGSARSIPVVFSSWTDDPGQRLVTAISKAIGPYLAGIPEPELPPDCLDAAIEIASGAATASLLLMLDQFEEYFLYCASEPTPERFADQLAACINRPDLRANFLIAIRTSPGLPPTAARSGSRPRCYNWLWRRSGSESGPRARMNCACRRCRTCTG